MISDKKFFYNGSVKPLEDENNYQMKRQKLNSIKKKSCKT